MQQVSTTSSFLLVLVCGLLVGVPASASPDTGDSEGGEASGSVENGSALPSEKSEETPKVKKKSEETPEVKKPDEAAVQPSTSAPAQEASESERSSTVSKPAPVLGAADHVQKALDRLATSQALVIASEEAGQDAASRAELSLQLLSARRSLEQALVAIGKLEGAGDLRALLEESGFVLSEGEKDAAIAEQERLRGLSPERFQEVVAAMTSVSFSEGRMQQLQAELKDQRLTADQTWSLVELFDFSRDRVEALVFLHPKIVDPENFPVLLGGLKFESDRETVRSRLGLGG